MRAGLAVDEIRDEAALRALVPEWSELWERGPASTPFQSPAWLLPWRRHFTLRDWLVLALRRHGRLIGLMPLFLVEDAEGRRLLPMGAGVSDYLGGVFEPNIDPEEVRLLLADLAPWGALDLPQLPPDSPLLKAAAPPGWSDELWPGEPCPTLPLPAALPPRIAQNLRYCRRRAERAGTVRWERADVDCVLARLEDLFRLHSVRWDRLGQPGVLADEAVQRFHREAAPALAEAGLLRLDTLWLDDRPVAVLYGLLAKGRAYHYIGGFDPDRASLGPGALIVGCAIEEATREGAREFDFLRGREQYKYRWGARDRPTFGRRLRAQHAR